MRSASNVVWQALRQDLVQVVVPFPSLARVIRLYAGETAVVLSAPGIGKTTFAMNWAARSKAKTLYMSTDTSSRNMAIMLAAMTTGVDKEEIRKEIDRDRNPYWEKALKDYRDETRRAYPDLMYDFSPMPDLNEVVQKAYALSDIWGRYPELIVIDIATGIAKGGDDYASWDRMWAEIKVLARHLGSGVIVCHHINQGYGASGNVAPQLNSGQYRPDKHAEIVLGLHAPGPHEFVLTALKNRDGKKDVTVPMIADHPISTIVDPED